MIKKFLTLSNLIKFGFSPIMTLLIVTRFFMENRWSFFSLCSLAIAFVLLFFFSKVVVGFPEFIKSQNRTHKIILTLLTVVFLANLIIFWPGQVGDDLNILSWLAKGSPSDWLSFSYSVLIQALIFFSGFHFSVSLFNLCLLLYLVCQFLSLTSWHFKNPLTVLVITTFASPIATLLIIYQNRDSTYSLLMLILIFAILNRKYGQSNSFKLSNYLILAIGVLLSDMRQDGKYFLILVPLIIAAVEQFSLKKALSFLGVSVVAGFGLFAIPEQFVKMNEFSAYYRSSGLVNPLSYIVKHVGLENFSEDQKINLGRFMNNINVLVDHYSPYDLNPFYFDGPPNNRSEEDYRVFQRTALEIFTEHPTLFLENRTLMFLRLHNIDPGSFFVGDQIRNPFPDYIHEAAEHYGLRQLPTTELQKTVSYYTQVFLWELPKALHLLLASTLIPLLTILLLLFTYKKHPAIALCSFILLVRVIYFAVLAPAAYFKYISSIWLGGWILGLLYLNLRSQKMKL